MQKYFTYEKMHRVTIAISHDQFLVPWVAVVSNGQIDMKFHDHNANFNYWLNNLAGIALIVNENNEVISVPVKGLNTGFLGGHCLNDNDYNGDTENDSWGSYSCQKYKG